MWLPVLTLLLVGAAHAELNQQPQQLHNFAWKSNNEYHYIVESRSLTGLPDVSNQYSGVLMRAVLKVQSKDGETLFAKMSKVEYAPVHTQLPRGWDSEIPEGMQEFKPLATSGKPFEVRMENGVIRELIFDKDVPTWEVNICKGVVSQLQVDTQGENMIASRSNQSPDPEQNNAMYKTMEDSVGGTCEVLYDINAAPESMAQQIMRRLPGVQYRTGEKVYEIMKTKDFSNCRRRAAVHFGVTSGMDFEPGSSKEGLVKKSSISEVRITGNLKSFTLHSSMTTEKLVLNPTFYDKENGVVASRVNLTLSKIQPISKPWQSPENGESVGSLVYTYNQPFSPEGDDRSPGSPSINYNFRNQESRSDPSSVEDAHRQHYDATSSSSSDESGSRESSENRKHHQPRPTLNDAPQYPFLPHFIANRGKACSNSNEIDLVNRAKMLASEIGRDVQNPNTIPQEHTLEKFSILVDILRTMNTKQMKEVQTDLWQPIQESDSTDEGQKVRTNAWVAFRDAVASVGSGPALMLITDLVKERKLTSLEMFSIFSVLAKSAKEPTPEYVNALFKLATLDVLRNDELASSAAILSFTELVRYAQIDRKTSHNRFPVHTFGNFATKKNDPLFKEYFPYLIENLERGIEANDYRAPIFIRALGNIAHPKIISVFEPYLEGMKPSTIFQRQMMVTAMDKLSTQHPKELQGLAFRLYVNPGESFKVRVPAAFLVMRSNPSLNILQRMAQNTNRDVSKQVSAVVKSLIESAAELKSERNQELAKKARAAKAFLTQSDFGLDYSTGIYSEDTFENTRVINTNLFAWIGSETSSIPEGTYVSSQYWYNDFKSPRKEHGSLVSSIKDLLEALKELIAKIVGEKSSPSKNSKSQEIANLLNIEADHREKLNTFFISRDKYSDAYYAVDEDMMARMTELLKLQDAAKALKSGKNFNMMNIQNYQLTIGLPIATGLPFTYDFQLPYLRKVSGKVQALSDPDYAEGDNGVPKNVDASADVRVVCSRRMMVRYGFVTPFEGQQYVTGLDRNIQHHVPVSAKVNYDDDQKQIRVKVEPMNKNEQSSLYHYSNVPFTSRHAVKDLKPVAAEDRPGKMIMKESSEEKTQSFGKETSGLSLKIREIKDRSSPSAFEKLADPQKVMEYMQSPMVRDDNSFYVFDAKVMPNPSSEQSVILRVQWDHAAKNKPTGEEESLESDRWSSEPEIKEPSDKEPNSSDRRRELMKEVLKDMPTGEACAIDVAVEMPGQEPRGVVATAAVAKSKAGSKIKSLMYIRRSDTNDAQNNFEMCAALQASHPLLPVFGATHINSEQLQEYIDAKVVLGKSCSRGQPIEIHGRQWQSEEFRNAIKSQRMRNPLSSAEKMMDRVRVIVHPADEPSENTWDKLPKEYMRSNKFQPRDESEYDDTAVFDFVVEPGTNEASMMMKAPGLGSFEKTTKMDRDLLQWLMTPEDQKDDRVCVLEQDKVVTFDGVSYPLNMNDCEYVALTPAPQRRTPSSKPTIPDDKQASITIRKDPNDQENREVTLNMGPNEIKMSKSSSDLEIKFNGKRMEMNQESMTLDEGKDNEIEVVRLPDESVVIKSKKYGMRVTYDGSRAMIKMSDKYRDSVRGLCSNFDGEKNNDFLTPRNRLASNPEDFSALYTLPVAECKSVAQNLRMMEKSLPRDSPRFQNVVSDRDAGRSTHPKDNWGPQSSPKSLKNQKNTIVRTKVIPYNDQTCFTLRPLPTCVPDTEPQSVRTVLFPVFCLPNGDSANRLADRINRGANPDLSQKSPSMKVKLDIPERCSLAA